MSQAAEIKWSWLMNGCASFLHCCGLCASGHLPHVNSFQRNSFLFHSCRLPSLLSCPGEDRRSSTLFLLLFINSKRRQWVKRMKEVKVRLIGVNSWAASPITHYRAIKRFSIFYGAGSIHNSINLFHFIQQKKVFFYFHSVKSIVKLMELIENIL